MGRLRRALGAVGAAGRQTLQPECPIKFTGECPLNVFEKAQISKLTMDSPKMAGEKSGLIECTALFLSLSPSIS